MVIGESSVLLVSAEKSMPVWKSANNVPDLKTLLSGYINVRDLLSHETVLLTKDAVKAIEAWLGVERLRWKLRRKMWRLDHACI